jgi:hypothetical protein
VPEEQRIPSGDEDAPTVDTTGKLDLECFFLLGR